MGGAASALAIQIVNYRTRGYLERCLSALERDLDHSGLSYEVHVLDNDSGDDLTDLPARFARSHVHQSPTNVGFGAGQNLLARRSKGDHLLILNPDVEFIQPDTTRRLLSVLQSGERVSAAGPKLLTEAGVAQRWDHGRLHGLRAQIAVRAGDSYWRPTDRRQEVAWVSGAVMLIERAAFDEVGGFDERFFLFKEEEDLCLQMRRAGHRIVYDPSIVVRHHGSVVARKDAVFAESIAYYRRKNLSDGRLRRGLAVLHRRLPW
ncbi:MAG TPA: glycosyltransferase family 2 protein [Solirubrobacteraceae bacterium]|nr:glycosyltransferase family 2 protein [Solirubrobacteraceae bacterium]